GVAQQRDEVLARLDVPHLDLFPRLPGRRETAGPGRQTLAVGAEGDYLQLAGVTSEDVARLPRLQVPQLDPTAPSPGGTRSQVAAVGAERCRVEVRAVVVQGEGRGARARIPHLYSRVCGMAPEEVRTPG